MKKVVIDSPAALAAHVPNLIGFTPQHSLVFVGVSDEGKVALTLRYDLPGTGEEAREQLVHAAMAMVNAEAAEAVAIIYGTGQEAQPAIAALADVNMAEILRIEGNRYWSCVCTDERCCPAEGTPFQPADIGIPVLADRAALTAQVAPVCGERAQAMQEAVRRAVPAPGVALAPVSAIAVYRGGASLTDGNAALVLAALRDIRVRDDAWARMDPEYSRAHLRLWTDLTRLAPPGYVAAPASLLAFCAWQAGNGALANVALDRAFADDPGYTMAALLRQALNAGAPPALARVPMTPEQGRGEL